MTDVTKPALTFAFPIVTIPELVTALTNIFVWSPTLYPDPLFPIDTDVTVPAADIIAVPPAATKGWYPKFVVSPT